MSRPVKILLIVFVLYAMIAAPAQAADFTRNAADWTWGIATQLFDAVLNVGDRLFGG